MIIRLCDNCSDQVPEESQLIQIGAFSGTEWVVMDLCGKGGVLDVLGIGLATDEPEDDDIQEVEQQAPTLFDEVMKEYEDEPVKPENQRSVFLRRKPQDSVNNEKKFKEEAQRISGDQTGVTRRGYNS